MRWIRQISLFNSFFIDFRKTGFTLEVSRAELALIDSTLEALLLFFVSSLHQSIGIVQTFGADISLVAILASLNSTLKAGVLDLIG